MPTTLNHPAAVKVSTSPACLNGRPLRVLMLTDCFPKPSNQTLGVWALSQARGLVQAGADVRVFSPTPWFPRALRFHPKTRRLTDCPSTFDWGQLQAEYPRWPYYNFGGRAKLLRKRPGIFIAFAQKFLQAPLRRVIESWKPDVVFVHHTVPSGPIAIWIKKTFGIPFVTQDHDFGSIENCRRFPGRRKVFSQTAGEVYAATAVAKKIADSMREQFGARLNMPLYMGTPPIDPSLGLRPKPAEWASKRVVFSAAGFFERKAIPELIEAFTAVAKQRPDVILRLGGDGPCKPQVLEAIAKSGLADRIHLLGMLNHDQVLQEMAWCDVFMLIGWDEPFAVVYLEAMSAGKPIICCNDGGICEVMQDGQQGRAVPPHDVAAAGAALDQLLFDDELRLRMGAAAYELFEQRLTMEAISRETLELLKTAATSNA